MHISIYADVLFLTNFLANFLLLHLTKKISKASTNILRLLASACLGSLYAMLLFFMPLTMWRSVLLHLLIGVAMLTVAFRFRSAKQLIQCALLYFSISLLSGGICYALFFLTSLGIASGAVLKNGVFYWHVPIYIIPIAFLLAYALCHALEKLLGFYALRKKNLYTLKLKYGDRQVTLRALVDTGNALYDPFNSLPVIVAEKSSAADLLTPETNTDTLHQIPYRTLEGKQHFLPAIKPDSIQIDGRAANDCMLALTDAKLSFDGQYTALLHNAAFQGGQYEHHTKLTQNS